MNERRRLWKLAGRYSTVGIEMAAAIGFSSLAGQWRDEQLGTEPYLLFFGMVVGTGAAVKTIQRIIAQAKRDKL